MIRRFSAQQPRSLRVVTAPASAPDGVNAAPLTDEQIILGVQRGDAPVAAELYNRLVGTIDNTLYRIFGRREVDHDDLIQAVFVQIVATLSRRSYAGACSLRTWASTIASHVGFNALRSRQRERRVLDRGVPLEVDLPFQGTSDVEGEANARGELERVRVHLADMKPKYAETVFLHDVLGHELAEISTMMKVSVAAAQSRLVRGRHELFRRLEKERAGTVGKKP